MRHGFVVTETLVVALFTVIVSVIFDNESDGMITRVIYSESNNTTECAKSYPKIIFTDR